MGCIKITWNIINLCYSILALVIAFESHDRALEVLALSLMIVHFFFVITVNALTTRDLNESISSLECFMLMENCIIILLTALLIIFTTDRHLVLFALPFICYISPLHIVCLCVACLNHSGYRFLQTICLKRCHRSCECSSQNSKCLRKCSKLEGCFTRAITCTCCCKPRRRIVMLRESMKLRNVLKKNLPKSTLNISRQTERSLAQKKKREFKDSSNILQFVKSNERTSSQSNFMPQNGNHLEVTIKQRIKAQNSGKTHPERGSQLENSFSSLKEGMRSIRSLKIFVVEENGEEPEKERAEEHENEQVMCMLCEKWIKKRNEVAVITNCQHKFHGHCLRIHAKERGQRVCARCGANYKRIEYEGLM